MSVLYAVSIPMAETDEWFRVCECLTAEHAAEVTRCLLNGGEHPPMQVRVDKILFPDG